MASVFKRGNGKYWYAAWTDADGKPVVKSTKQTDKATAQRIANKKEEDAALRRDGVIDGRGDKFAENGRRPIEEQLKDFEQSQYEEENNEDYIKQNVARARRIVKLAKAETLADLGRDNIKTALASLRKKGLSAGTYNTYLRSIRSFVLWAMAGKRLRDDVCDGFELLSEQDDRRRERRELSSEEMFWLLSETEKYTSPQHQISGPDRAMAYRVAFGTGFRRGELRTLNAKAFDLAAEPPVINLKKGKDGKPASQPIHPSLAAAIKPWLAGKDKDAKVFAYLPGETGRMMQADLANARKAWIAAAKSPAERQERSESDFLTYQDKEGRFADFHATRHTYISGIVSSGASVKVAQELARHSTPTLTIGRYAHVRRKELSAALPESAENMHRICYETGHHKSSSGNQPNGKNGQSDTIGKAKASGKMRDKSLSGITSHSAEGTRFELATGCPAPHFQCGR